LVFFYKNGACVAVSVTYLLTHTQLLAMPQYGGIQACRGYEIWISHPCPYPYPQMPILRTCSPQIFTK